MKHLQDWERVNNFDFINLTIHNLSLLPSMGLCVLAKYDLSKERYRKLHFWEVHFEMKERRNLSEVSFWGSKVRSQHPVDWLPPGSMGSPTLFHWGSRKLPTQQTTPLSFHHRVHGLSCDIPQNLVRECITCKWFVSLFQFRTDFTHLVWKFFDSSPTPVLEVLLEWQTYWMNIWGFINNRMKSRTAHWETKSILKLGVSIKPWY